MELPNDVLGEICKHAGSAGRRMLALTCSQYLVMIPRICHRKIATFKASDYKLLSEIPHFLQLVPSNTLHSFTFMYASARYGSFPDCFYTPGVVSMIGNLPRPGVAKIIEIAYRHGSSMVLSWLRTKYRVRGWPFLAISRGHYQIAKEGMLYGDSKNKEDCKYLTEGALEYCATNLPWEIMRKHVCKELAGLGRLDQLQKIESLGMKDLPPKILVRSSANNHWEVFNHYLPRFAGGLTPMKIVPLVLNGAYYHISTTYPDMLIVVPYNLYLCHPAYPLASQDIKLQLFRDSVRECGFARTLERYFKRGTALSNDVIVDFLRESSDTHLVPESVTDMATLKMLFSAGAKPLDLPEHQIPYAMCRENYGLTFQEIIEAFKLNDSALWQELIPDVIKHLNEKPAMSPSDRAMFVRAAYILDNLGLLLAVIGDSTRYPHTKFQSLLPKESVIRAWRTSLNLPCALPAKRRTVNRS